MRPGQIEQASAKPLWSSKDENPRSKADSSLPGDSHLHVREADHRISNSLQLIAALLSQEERRLSDAAACQALVDARRRVTTVAQLHRYLCQTELPEWVELDEFLQQLCDDLQNSFVDGRMTLLVNVDPVSVSPTTARDLGLIISELTINAFKHAFPDGREGVVQIACGLDTEGRIVLEVSDDGAGYLPAKGTSSGLGMKMVSMLVAQMKGRLDVVASGSRIIHRITIPR